MIDTYNQQIQYDVSCTIRTNINTANHHFIVELCNTKENILTPTKVSTGTQHSSSLEDNLGGISRCVKTDDSLAVMVEPKAVSYTRDSKGKTQNKHLNEIANTIHASTGSGGNTDCFVVEPLNPYEDGTCRTIKAQYQQSSRANFARQDGLGATGVVQIENIVDVSNSITTVQKDSLVAEPLRIPEATALGYAEAHEGDSVNLAVPNSKTRRGRVGKQMANTLDTGCQQGVVEQENNVRYRIRKLTPRECFRLMGVDDADIDKIQASGISNSQQYKCAGNSIVVDVLYHIFRRLYIDTTPTKPHQPTLFDL